MKKKIKFTTKSINTLKAVIYYKAEQSPKDAALLLNRLNQSIDSITTFPNIGIKLQTQDHQLNDLRYIFSSGYIIFYRIDFDIIIEGIYSTKQDYIKLLFDSTPLS